LTEEKAPIAVKTTYTVALECGFDIRVSKSSNDLQNVQLQIVDRTDRECADSINLTAIEWRTLFDLYYMLGVYPPKPEETA